MSKPVTLPPGSYKTKKAKNVVLPSDLNMFARPNYKVGDGDTPRFVRPGSDHSQYKSKGFPC